MATVDDVKCIIKAILLSSTKEMTLNELYRYYKTNEGGQIPTFGYPSIYSFLQSIKDCVKIQGEYIYPVSSDKTAHLAELVSKQVTKVSRGYCPRRKNRVLPNTTIEDCRPRVQPLLYQFAAKDGTSIRKLAEIKPMIISEQETQKLLAYLKDKQEGASIESLQSIIPQNSMWKICTYKQCTQIIVDQCPTIFVNNHRLYSKQCYENTVAKCLDDTTCGTQHNQSKLSIYLQTRDNLVEFRRKTGQNGCCNGSVCSDDSNTTSSVSSLSYNQWGQKPSTCSLQQVKHNIEELVLEHKDKGVWCGDILKLYSKKFKHELCYQKYGYYSLIQLLGCMGDVVKYVRPGNGDWCVYHVTHMARTNSSGTNSSTDVTTNVVPKYVVDNVAYCLSHFDNGIKSSEFLQVYKTFYRVDLDLEELGFTCVKSLFKSLASDKIEYLLIDHEPSIRRVVHDSSEEEKLNLRLDEDLYLKLFPVDVAGPHYIMKPVSLFDVKKYDHVDVCVSEVWNPHMFYINLRRNKTEYHQLLDQLQALYQETNAYKMPECVVRRGQLCGVQEFTGREWFRGRIMDTNLASSQVTVKLLDHGTWITVSLAQIRFLPLEVAKFPAQAIPACLANVKTCILAKDWPVECCHKFHELICSSDLVAGVVEVDVARCWLHIELYNTSSKIETDIGCELIKAGLAAPPATSVTTNKLVQLLTKPFVNFTKHNITDETFEQGLVKHLLDNKPLPPTAFTIFQQTRHARKQSIFPILKDYACVDVNEVYLHLSDMSRNANCFDAMRSIALINHGQEYEKDSRELNQLMKLVTMSEEKVTPTSSNTGRTCSN